MSLAISWCPQKQNTEDCDVPTGASCENDSQCGQGRFIQDDGNQIFPEGYCVLDEGGCAPRDSVLHSIDLEKSSLLVWAKTCERNSDCRVDDSYSCNILAQACLPVPKAFFIVDPKLDYVPLCTPPIPE